MLRRAFDYITYNRNEGDAIIFGTGTAVLVAAGAPWLYPIVTGGIALKSLYNVAAEKLEERRIQKIIDAGERKFEAEQRQQEELYAATRASAAADPGKVVDLEALRVGGP